MRNWITNNKPTKKEIIEKINTILSGMVLNKFQFK